MVCWALGNGRQSILLRKGGIAEGREGFAFKHREFLLFPTWFHEQVSKTTLPPEVAVPEPAGDDLVFDLAATVEWTALVTDRSALAGLREFHILRDSVVDERFAYDGVEGIHVAFVRIFRLEPAFCTRREASYGGCRSWIDLPDSGGSAWVSVLSDEEHARRGSRLAELLGLAR